jgi:hypothetical protein
MGGGEGERPGKGEQVPLCICSSTPLSMALKPPPWAFVHTTTYALCIMFWMRSYPLLGQVGGGKAVEFLSFLGPKRHSPIGSMPFTGPKKLSNSRA